MYSKIITSSAVLIFHTVNNPRLTSPEHRMAFGWYCCTPFGVQCQYDYILAGGDSVYIRIRDLRDNAGLTQKQISEIIHMHKTTYARYETGEREIPLNVAILLARYYNVSLDYLAGLTNKEK